MKIINKKCDDCRFIPFITFEFMNKIILIEKKKHIFF